MRVIVIALLLPVSRLSLSICKAEIVISEIADRGTSSVCGGGNDWLELHNSDDAAAVDLSDGYVLHDNRGMNHASAYKFPPRPQQEQFLLQQVCELFGVSEKDFTIIENWVRRLIALQEEAQAFM